jgi:ubiquinone/menaquinone biosynthesis C-methylase UbiE
MADYYLEGEERFGPVLSFLYLVAVKFVHINGIYDFVVNDIMEAGVRTVLDVGTGPGDVPIRLAKEGGVNAFGIDPSKDMIGIAVWRSRKMDRVRFATGSSRHVPFKMKFDIICTSISYHHWERKAESLDYLSGFLGKGGEIRIYEFNSRKLRGVARGAKAHALRMDELRKTAGKTRLRISGVREKGQFIRVSLKRR